MINLTHFKSMSFFISPEIQRFRMFSGGIKRENCLEMVQQLPYSKLISHTVSIFLKFCMAFLNHI